MDFKDKEQGSELALALSLVLNRAQRREWSEVWELYQIYAVTMTRHIFSTVLQFIGTRTTLTSTSSQWVPVRQWWAFLKTAIICGLLTIATQYTCTM